MQAIEIPKPLETIFGFEIDLLRHRLLIGGRVEKIKPQQITILKTLIDNYPNGISQDDMISLVYEGKEKDYLRAEAILRSQVSTIRSMLRGRCVWTIEYIRSAKILIMAQVEQWQTISTP